MVDVPGSTGGGRPQEIRWYVYVEDPQTSQRSAIFDFRTPGFVTVYDATSLSTISQAIDVTVSSTESTYHQETTITDGTLDLEGVPDEQLLVRFQSTGPSTAS